MLAAGERLPGLLGSVAALVTVEPGFEGALAAALGAVADAVAVGSADDATTALHLLKADDAGRAGLLVGDEPRRPGPVAARGPAPDPASVGPASVGTNPADIVAGTTAATAAWPSLPDGARWAVDVVRAPDAIAGAVAHALDRWPWWPTWPRPPS